MTLNVNDLIKSLLKLDYQDELKKQDSTICCPPKTHLK